MEGDAAFYDFRYDKVFSFYDELVLEPYHVNALNGKANALSRLNRYEEALAIEPTNVTLLHPKRIFFPTYLNMMKLIAMYNEILPLTIYYLCSAEKRITFVETNNKWFYAILLRIF